MQPSVETFIFRSVRLRPPRRSRFPFRQPQRLAGWKRGRAVATPTRRYQSVSRRAALCRAAARQAEPSSCGPLTTPPPCEAIEYRPKRPRDLHLTDARYAQIY